MQQGARLGGCGGAAQPRAARLRLRRRLRAARGGRLRNRLSRRGAVARANGLSVGLGDGGGRGLPALGHGLGHGAGERGAVARRLGAGKRLAERGGGRAGVCVAWGLGGCVERWQLERSAVLPAARRHSGSRVCRRHSLWAAACANACADALACAPPCADACASAWPTAREPPPSAEDWAMADAAACGGWSQHRRG